MQWFISTLQIPHPWLFCLKKNAVDSKNIEKHSEASFVASPTGPSRQSVFRCCTTETFLYFRILDSVSSFSSRNISRLSARTWPMQIKVQARPFAFAFFNGSRLLEESHINITKKEKNVVDFKYRTRPEFPFQLNKKFLDFRYNFLCFFPCLSFHRLFPLFLETQESFYHIFTHTHTQQL